MRVLVVNRSDRASTNMRDRLLETDEWVEVNFPFRGHPMYQRGYDMLLQVDGPVIRDEDLDQDLADKDWPIHAVWFLSKHRAASGVASLTVHPIGNWGDNRVGGKPKALAPSHPKDMSALLRRLAIHGKGLEHEITFEATHHGPWLRYPSMFLEIGSTDAHDDNVAAGQAWQKTIHDVLDGEGDVEAPLVVGVGGGHYAPRFTEKVLEGVLNVGHMVPSHAIPIAEDGTVDLTSVELALAATPGAELAIHKKGLKGPQRQAILAWAEANQIPIAFQG